MIVNDKLKPMRYKNYVWSNNPSTCSYTCDKNIIKHKYPELDAVELEDLDPDGIVLTGTGEFFGPDAYNQWNELLAVFRKHGPGEFFHPIYTDIKKASIKRLQSNIEPRANYIQYSFEIWEHRPVPIVIKKTVAAVVSPVSSESDGVIKVGDTVICNGNVYASSDGLNMGVLLTNKEMVVTYTNYGPSWSIKPVHVGTHGWMALSDVKLKGSTSSDDTIVVVVSGDTLSGICSRYGADWKEVAAYNNIKNPHLIHPGDKIKIQK